MQMENVGSEVDRYGFWMTNPSSHSNYSNHNLLIIKDGLLDWKNPPFRSMVSPSKPDYVVNVTIQKQQIGIMLVKQE